MNQLEDLFRLFSIHNSIDPDNHSQINTIRMYLGTRLSTITLPRNHNSNIKDHGTVIDRCPKPNMDMDMARMETSMAT